MSLLNDLIPEVRQRLEADKAEYPMLYENTIRQLTESMFTCDVSVTTANLLLNYAESAGVEFDNNNFILKLYTVFGK